MREDIGEVLTGAAVVVAAGAFLIYAAGLTGGGGPGGGSYDLSASFRSAEGVGVGTDVRLAGVKIGTVSGMELNPTTYRAETTLTLAGGIEIPSDSVVAVASEGLLGGSFIEIVPGGSFDLYLPGDEILDTQGAVSVVSLLLRFVTGGEE